MSIAFTLVFMTFSSSFLISCTSDSRFCFSCFLISTSSSIFVFVDVGFLIRSMRVLLVRFKPFAFAYCARDSRLFLSSPLIASLSNFCIFFSTPSMFLAANGFCSINLSATFKTAGFVLIYLNLFCSNRVATSFCLASFSSFSCFSFSSLLSLFCSFLAFLFACFFSLASLSKRSFVSLAVLFALTLAFLFEISFSTSAIEAYMGPLPFFVPRNIKPVLTCFFLPVT